MRHYFRIAVAIVALVAVASAQAADPLPSWNEGPTKQSILDFVAKVTKEGGADFVPPAERIATFDNDGTLWPEDPITFEFAFAIDRIKETAASHPEWKEKQPFKAVLENDVHNLVGQGRKALIELILATHAGMTTGEFDRDVRDWISKAKHPRYHCLYTDLGYQPMLEVLAYLRANGFKTFIVSGGGTEFMRVFADKLYGIPPEQVIGTMFKTNYELRNDKPVLTILPEVSYVDDKAGKAIAIHQLIGRHPVMAFGNSDGDWEMLQYTTIGRSPSFGLIVHHTDAEREYAYDAHPKSSGKLVEALAAAPKRGWTVVDMKKDWKVIFSFEK
jgi:phosphoserine phosphatase